MRYLKEILEAWDVLKFKFVEEYEIMKIMAGRWVCYTCRWSFPRQQEAVNRLSLGARFMDARVTSNFFIR